MVSTKRPLILLVIRSIKPITFGADAINSRRWVLEIRLGLSIGQGVICLQERKTFSTRWLTPQSHAGSSLYHPLYSKQRSNHEYRNRERLHPDHRIHQEKSRFDRRAVLRPLGECACAQSNSLGRKAWLQTISTGTSPFLTALSTDSTYADTTL